MVQAHCCQPGLQLCLSQKGIQREKSASKYKLKVGVVFSFLLMDFQEAEVRER